MKSRFLIPALLVIFIPALACSAPARLIQSLRATPTPLPSPTATPSPSPSPTPTLEPTRTPQPPVSLEDQPFEETSAADQYEITAVFPFLPAAMAGAEGFNNAMADFEQTTLAAFRADAAQAVPGPSAAVGSFLQTQYEVLYNQDNLLSLRMWISIYIKGAAHPGTFSRTFNFDLSTGIMLALDDLFQPGADYLPLLSRFCQAEILRRDSQFWANGADPQPENYRGWNLTVDGLLVTFDEYQVAPYAAGPQSVMVPYAELGGVLLPDGPVSRVLP
jgi:hypothetical protein